MKNFFKEKYNWLKKDENLRKVFLIIILIACFFDYISLKTEKKKLYSTFQNYSGSKYNWRQIRKTEININTKDIQSWMTFSYLNFVFKLPKDYLRTTLNINTSKYPNISIQKYTKLSNLDTNNFISQLKESIDNYNTNNANTK